MTAYVSQAADRTTSVHALASAADARVRRRRLHYAKLRRTVAAEIDGLRQRVRTARVVKLTGLALGALAVLAAAVAVVPLLHASVLAALFLAASLWARRLGRRAHRRLARAEFILRRAEREVRTGRPRV
jgi:Flp pilus assembly protein TadB